MAKSMRDTEKRKSQKRVGWQPRAMLETPPAPEGYEYRWVRHEVRGQDDARNVVLAQRQGYEFVSTDELPEDFVVQVAQDGKHTGRIINGDLILCKMPIENLEQKKQYYREKSRRLQDSVDTALDKHQSDVMPITVNKKSRVTRGQPDFEED